MCIGLIDGRARFKQSAHERQIRGRKKDACFDGLNIRTMRQN